MVRFTTLLNAIAVLSVPAAVAFSSSSRPIGSSAFVSRAPSTSTTTYSSSSTLLSMNMFERFQRVAKANINNILQKMEDPEKVMEQAVEDMQSDLVKVRQSYAEVTATQRRLMKQKEQLDAVANDWYNRAQLALKAGNEELAREALNRRQTQMDQAQSVQEQMDTQAASIDKLYEGMQLLEKKILESKSKKDEMVARARTAQSTQKVNDMLGGITGKTSMDAFSRMEEKVEALEAAAEVSAELGTMASGNALPGTAGSSLENEFKLLEGNAAVEDELAKMKGFLTGSDDSGSSSSSSTAAPSNPAVDDELEKLKKDAGL